MRKNSIPISNLNNTDTYMIKFTNSLLMFTIVDAL